MIQAETDDCLALRWKRSGGTLFMCRNMWWERVKRIEPDSSQWCPMKGREAQTEKNGNFI